jgi:uroporphyrinogen-III synthase
MPPSASFGGRSVLVLESRRANELATLVTSFGGTPLLAPSLREVPLVEQHDSIEFAKAVIRGDYDCVIFLTGVGLRLLLDVVDAAGLREPFVGALRRTKVVSRGPKPMPHLREMQVPVWILAPEPNTWREIVSSLDAKANEFTLAGARVAVQEYGISNVDLLAALNARHAVVTRVLVYGWSLPEDLEPLRRAVRALADGQVDVMLITSGVQLIHLSQVAQQLGLMQPMKQALATRTLIASIGPSASDVIRRYDLSPDLEASHPKMGMLVTEAAERAGEILRQKRR